MITTFRALTSGADEICWALAALRVLKQSLQQSNLEEIFLNSDFPS